MEPSWAPRRLWWKMIAGENYPSLMLRPDSSRKETIKAQHSRPASNSASPFALGMAILSGRKWLHPSQQRNLWPWNGTLAIVELDDGSLVGLGGVITKNVHFNSPTLPGLCLRPDA